MKANRRGKDEAYRTVQAVAMPAFESDGNFRQLVAADPTITSHLTETDLSACFDYEAHLKRIQAAYERMGV